jgi:DNA-binding MurR/RpiR family transcriptional regulator
MRAQIAAAWEGLSPAEHRVADATLDASSAVLAVSHTGRSRELIDNVAAATANRGVVITASPSPARRAHRDA